MPLQLYEGNFLISHAPLELSLNYCSHSCAYCFANIGHRDRETGLKSVITMIKDSDKRNNFVAWLLRNKYPVLISNRVDPFAQSNYREAVPIAAELTARDIPITWQTKGGRGIDDVLGFLPKPQLWYISITTLDAEISRRVEPAAPSPQERLALIEKLKAAGHRVVVGINPFVPEWCESPYKLMLEAQKRGAEGVWLEMLHLSAAQVKDMKPNEVKAMGGADKLKLIAKKKHVEPTLPYYFQAYQCAEELGLHPYGMSGFRPGYYTNIMHDVYPRCFPVLQDFANYLVSGEAGYDLQPVLFSEFADFMCQLLPEGEFFISDYVRSMLVGRNYVSKREGIVLKGAMSFRDMLRILWNTAALPNCIAQNFGFAFATQGGEILRDDSGDAVYLFTPGLDLMYVDIGE